MVLPIPVLLLYSIQPTLSLQTFNCCSAPPNIWALGPPPKPPWLKYKLSCNSTGVKRFGNTSEDANGSTAALQDTVFGGLTVVQLVILILCVLLSIAVFAILIIYVKKKYKATVKPDIVKEEETNYLYNYRILGRIWRGPQRRTSWRPKRTTGPEDEKYLVSGTPTSQLSLASNETRRNSNFDDEKEFPGTRRSSTSSGIGTSQGDSGPEVGSLSGGRPEFPALPLLAPIKSSTAPDKAYTRRVNCQRYVDPHTLKTTKVTFPNPTNWNVSEERTSSELKHGKLAPIRPARTQTPAVDGCEHSKKRRGRKRTTTSAGKSQPHQSVPLKTIFNGKINSELKLSTTPDISGESQA